MIDVFTVALPDTHIWAVVVAWLGAYIGGRHMVALR